MQTLTNAYVIDATHSTTQSVVYANPRVYNNANDTPWYRGIGGGISTVSEPVDADHVQVTDDRTAHGGSVLGGDRFNLGRAPSGTIITDTTLVTLASQLALP